MQTKKIHVGIVEDNSALRQGIVAFIDMQPDMVCSLQTGSVEGFFEKMNESNAFAPDILLLDINLPGMDGTAGLPLMKQQFPEMLIVMLTINNESDYIFKAICNGAAGYVLKGTPLAKLKDAMMDVYHGGSSISPVIARKVFDYFQPQKQQKARLTEKETQVVQCLVEGHSYKLCADRLNITLETVRFHIKNIYKKLQVNSKSEVVRKSLKGEIDFFEKL